MWAVVPVAGRSTRLSGLTRGQPKALLEVEGQSLLDGILGNLEDVVSEACLIVDQFDGPVARRFGRLRQGIRLHYVRQPVPCGVGDAILRAHGVFDGPFVVVMGDIYYSNPLSTYVEAWRSSGADGAVLVETLGEDAPDPTGIVHLDGSLVVSIEKTHADLSALRVCGMAVLPESAFDAAGELPRRPGKELELEEIIAWLIRERGARFIGLRYEGWRRNINTAADLESVSTRVQSCVSRVSR